MKGWKRQTIEIVA